MRLRCPACHAEASAQAWVEDDAARELMALLASLPAELGRPLVAYLGLWRPERRALSFDRALRLAREALELHTDAAVLAEALAQTVEAITAKRDAGDARPLASHNYLRRVIESTSAQARPSPVARSAQAASPAPRSATMDALQRLQTLKDAAKGA